MDYTEEQKRGFIQRFAALRKRQFIVTIPLFAILLGSIILEDSSTSTPFGVHHILWLSVLGVLLFGMSIFTVKNWRCPACNKYLGRGFNPTFCPKCGVQLKERKATKCIRQQSNITKQLRKYLKILAGAAIVIITFSIISVVYIESYGLPTEVVSGKLLKPSLKNEIIEKAALGPDEEIVYFHSNAFFDLEVESHILTNRRFIVFEDDPEGPISIYPEWIVDIDYYPPEGWLDLSVIELTFDNGNKYQFELDQIDNKDKEFYLAFRNMCGLSKDSQ